MNEQSVMSSPGRFRCEIPCSLNEISLLKLHAERICRSWNYQLIGVNGNLQTTRPSKIELNMLSSAVKVKPMANIDFIFT